MVTQSPTPNPRTDALPEGSGILKTLPLATPSLNQPLSSGHESAPDWFLAPITPPLPEQTQPGAQKSLPMESARAWDSPQEPGVFTLALDPNVPGQKSLLQSDSHEVSDHSGADETHGYPGAWETTPLARKTMVPVYCKETRYKKILLFGVLPLLLASVVAGAYLFRKVVVREASYAYQELPSFPMEPILHQAASAMEPGRSVADVMMPEETSDKGFDNVSLPSIAMMERRPGKASADDPPSLENAPGLPLHPNERQVFLTAKSRSIRGISMVPPEDAPQPNMTSKSSPEWIKITRTRVPDSLYARLVAGFNAFQEGDTTAAAATYRTILKENPDNRDALLGLAAVAMRERQWETAADCYARILRRNPEDAIAQAALLGLQDNLDPSAGEERIKRLLEKEPDVPYLHFSLGNFYARQSRWFEAERSYFDAYRADDANADYSYNLAVSLDHLAREKTALTYYRRALDLITGQSLSPGFDPSIVRRRIEAIEK